MEQTSAEKMVTLLYGIFNLVDKLGIDIHIQQDGTVILSDAKEDCHRSITQEGIKAVREDWRSRTGK